MATWRGLGEIRDSSLRWYNPNRRQPLPRILHNQPDSLTQLLRFLFNKAQTQNSFPRFSPNFHSSTYLDALPKRVTALYWVTHKKYSVQKYKRKQGLCLCEHNMDWGLGEMRLEMGILYVMAGHLASRG